MPRKAKEKEDDLLAAMRRAIMAVLNNQDADLADRVKAIEAGAKILQIEHKISGTKGSKRGFFPTAGDGS